MGVDPKMHATLQEFNDFNDCRNMFLIIIQNQLNNFFFGFLFRGMTVILDWIGCELKEVCKTL